MKEETDLTRFFWCWLVYFSCVTRFFSPLLRFEWSAKKCLIFKKHIMWSEKQNWITVVYILLCMFYKNWGLNHCSCFCSETATKKSGRDGRWRWGNATRGPENYQRNRRTVKVQRPIWYWQDYIQGARGKTSASNKSIRSMESFPSAWSRSRAPIQHAISVPHVCL